MPFLVLLPLIESSGGMENATSDTLLGMLGPTAFNSAAGLAMLLLAGRVVLRRMFEVRWWAQDWEGVAGEPRFTTPWMRPWREGWALDHNSAHLLASLIIAAQLSSSPPPCSRVRPAAAGGRVAQQRDIRRTVPADCGGGLPDHLPTGHERHPGRLHCGGAAK